MEGLFPYIENYDFVKGLEPYNDKFVFRDDVKSFIINGSEYYFKQYVSDYWSNLTASSDKLHIKYSIPQSIRFDEIIKAYPTESYIQFLKDFWNPDNTLEMITKKYFLFNEHINFLAIPIELPEWNSFCMHCLRSNKFMIKRKIVGKSSLEYQIFCKTCNIESNHFLSEIEVENERAIGNDLYGEFLNEIGYVENELEQKKCPECSSKLIYRTFTNKIGYEIYCPECKKKWGSIARLLANIY